MTVTTTTLADAIVAATATKHRLQKGMRNLQSRTRNRAAFGQIKGRLVGKNGLLHQYADELKAIRAIADDSTIEAEIAELQLRLARGFGMEPMLDEDGNDKVEQQFNRLLLQYEVLNDALNYPTRPAFYQRVYRWEDAVK